MNPLEFFYKSGPVLDAMAWPGVLGNGIHDDRAGLQSLLDAAEAATCPGCVVTVRLGGGRTFLVNASGALKQCQHTGAGGVFDQGYALAIGNGVLLDLAGATLKLGDRQNVPIIVNKNLLWSLPANANLGVVNGRIDGNRMNQTGPLAPTTMESILFMNVDGLLMRDIHFVGSRQAAMRWHYVRHFFIDNLEANGSDNVGFQFGIYAPGDVYDQRIANGAIATLRARDSSIIFPGATGNGFVITAKDVVIDQLIAEACGGGTKLQDGSESVAVGRSVFNAAMVKTKQNSSSNGGTKIQGTSAAPIKHCSFGEIISTECEGFGLHVNNTEDCSVGSYTGRGNSTNGDYTDVNLLASKRLKIATIDSNLAGQVGVLVGSDVDDYQLGRISVLNPGSVTTDMPAVQIVSGAGKGYIDSILARDDRGAGARMFYGLHVAVTTATGVCGLVDVSGYKATTPVPIRNESQFYEIQRAILDVTAPVHGQVTLVPGTTQLVVANANAFRRDLGPASGNMSVLIELRPLNSAARSLVPSGLVLSYFLNGNWPTTGFTAASTATAPCVVAGTLEATSQKSVSAETMMATSMAPSDARAWTSRARARSRPFSRPRRRLRAATSRRSPPWSLGSGTSSSTISHSQA
jgi:hypothetical protein